jgi:hypothetical protein
VHGQIASLLARRPRARHHATRPRRGPRGLREEGNGLARLGLVRSSQAFLRTACARAVRGRAPKRPAGSNPA